MSKPWKEEQGYLIKVLDDYRNLIKDKDLIIAKRLTKEFAVALHKNTPELFNRSIEAINQRMPYLDNLLAGVFEKNNYALKDQSLYGAKLRQMRNVEPNLCNTRHAYNGAIR